MTTDDVQTFWAAGFDSEGNFRGDESVTWTSTIGINGTGTSILFSPDTPISGTLTATSGIVNYSTGTIDVTVGALNYLIIRDDFDGGGSEVTAILMTADDGIILYAAGYDADGNFRQDEDATWTLTGSLDQPGSSGTSFSFNPFTAPTTGAILATAGSASDASGTITVDPGGLNSLLIRTAPDNGGNQVIDFPMTTDDSQTFYSAGYDTEGNYRGDEAATNWSSTGDLGISGSGASILFAPTAPVSGTLIADVGGSPSYETGSITVTGGGIDHIIIRDAADGGGSEVTTHSMTTDNQLILFAAGYDAQNNFIENSLVNWSLTGGLDGTPVSDTIFTFDPAVAGTNGTIVAQIGAGTIQDVTGNITVNPGALNSLLIRTATNNGGSQVTTLLMTTDETYTFWSAGYDADGNYRGDEAATNWGSTGDLGISGSGASILFAPTAPVSGTLIADVGGSPSYETGTITVGTGIVDHIIIRDAADGLGNEVSDILMTADDSVTVYAAGYDGENNFIQNSQVNWSTTGSLDITLISDTVFVFSPSTAPTTGTIVAQVGTNQDVTGTITVSQGALASLLIRDNSNNQGNVVITDIMSAGDSRTFWAAGYDGEGNYRADETTAVWTSTFGLGGTGSSFIFNPTLPDTGTITVTIDAIEYTTGDIIVGGGILQKLIIRDGPNGGGNDLTGVARTLTADSSLTLFAAGYDASDNYIGDRVVDWYSTGSIDYITANASSYTFNPVRAPASGTIGITNGTFGRTTGLFTINVGDLNYITINDAAGGDGVEINDYTMNVGSSLPLHASGYDSDNNYIRQVEVDWSSTGSLDPVSGTATSYLFDPVSAPTTGTIVADTAGLFTDETGVIEVEQGALFDIVIRTATGGGGVVYGDTTMTTDETLTLYAAGYDIDNNYLFDVSSSWSSTGTLDGIFATNTFYTFDPVTSPTSGTIVATSGIYSDQTGTIDVSVGAFDHVRINSSAGAAGEEVGLLTLTADDTYTLHVASYDADNNYIEMTDDAVWDKTGTLNDVSGTGSSYFFDPVTAPTSGTITATSGGDTDATGTITVNQGALSYMQINDAPGPGGVEIDDVNLNVGVPLELYASGYDQHGNYIGPESSIWTSAGALDPIFHTGESFTFTPITANPAGGTISANSVTNGTVSDTTGQITVEEGVLTWIQIRTAAHNEGTEFGEYNMTVDGTVTLYAAGYDAGDNFIGNTIVDWSSTGGLETISVSDTSFEFSPTQAPTEGRIRITSGAMNDETGDITVSAGAAVTLSDFDVLSGERTTVAGRTQIVSVRVEDQYGNPVPGISVDFSPAGDMSVPTDITDSDGKAESVYNTPSTADSSFVQASVSGLSPYNFTVYGIKYVSGSLDPVVAQRGGTPTFTMQVSNPGNSTVTLATASSNFFFENGSFSYLATLASPASLPPNSPAITLTFNATEIDASFPGGSYTGEIQLVGSGIYSSMNGVLTTDIGELTIGTDEITIATGTVIGPSGNNQLLQGDQNIIARIPVHNAGTALEIDVFPDTRIEFRRADTGELQPVDNLQRTDGIPFLLGGGVLTELEFEFDLPAEYPTGTLNVFLNLSLEAGNLIVSSGESPAAFFEVKQAGNANYVEESLNPDEVVPREVANFSASFENTGSARITLNRAASTIEIVGSGVDPSSLLSQFILQGNSTTELFFEPMTIPVDLSTGNYNVRWRLNGNLDNGTEFDSTAVITGELTVLSTADLSFSNIDISQDKIKVGQAGIEITYTLNNEGESTANITTLNHQFNFAGGAPVPEGEWFPTQVSPDLPVEVAPGGNRDITVTYNLSTTASTGIIIPDPIVTYNDVRTPTIDYNSNTIVQNDQVEVVEPASVKIIQLQASTPNPQYVNENQQFNLEVTLENNGADDIQTAWVTVKRNNEIFTDQLILTDIAAGTQKSASFQHLEPEKGTFVYLAEIDSALDVVGDDVFIDQPDDRDELMYVQVPSQLEMDASIVYNAAKYDSLTVSEEQEFTVQAKIVNSGESAFDPEGNGQLSLRLPSGNFSYMAGPADSLRTFTETDTVVEWLIEATGISPGGLYEELAFALVSVPIDVNTGEEVADISILDNSVHLKSEQKGDIIRNDADILSPEGAQDGSLSTKQEFIVRADIEYNSTIAVEGRTAEIYLPFDYTLKDGEQLIVDLSAGGIPQWTVIAPDRDRTAVHYIYVTATGFDRNSELPVERVSNQIALQVAERTDLRMALQILKIGGEPGDTLSVGQEFTLQAIVNNDGNARAIGDGELYLEGIGENDAIEYSDELQQDIQPFTIGLPVTWDLKVVDLPEGQAGLQSQIFQAMDELEKAKTKSKMASNNNEIAANGSKVRELYTKMSDLIQALIKIEMDLTVSMSQIPTDENTNQTAFTEDSVTTKKAFIQPIAAIIIQDIVSPTTVSTEQEFDVIITGSPIENIDEAEAHLVLPLSFKNANDNQDIIDIPLDEENYQAHFKIKVPTTVNYFGAARESLLVYLTGVDKNSGLNVIPSSEVPIVLNVELRPEIFMGYEIISPIAARETGALSHGQTITVEVWPSMVPSGKSIPYATVINDGNIELDNEIFSKYKFEPIDGQSYKQQFTGLDQRLSFELRAPRDDETALLNFKFVDLPEDNNSGLEVDVSGDSGLVSLPMSVVEKKITVMMQKEIDKKTFTRGDGEHLMMVFEISNADYLDSLLVQGLGIKFIARSDTAALLNSAILNIFEKIMVMDYDELPEGIQKISSITSYADFEVNESTVSNPLQINFDDLETLDGQESKKLAVVAVFRKGQSSRSFRTILNNVDAFDDTPQHLVSIVDEEGRSIEGNPNFQSDIFSIISTDQGETFGNFPNPFGRSPNETTDIRFVLNATSDVSLRVFSLAGELVKSSWNRNLTNLPGGEIYYVVWDGKNDEGDTVLNGVYICVIEIRSSEGTSTYTTKIAYIK
jgi:hypothetical protein